MTLLIQKIIDYAIPFVAPMAIVYLCSGGVWSALVKIVAAYLFGTGLSLLCFTGLGTFILIESLNLVAQLGLAHPAICDSPKKNHTVFSPYRRLVFGLSVLINSLVTLIK